MTVIERFKAEVPEIIKKVQKISAAIAGLATSGLFVANTFMGVEIPSWIMYTILGAGILNYIILQFTTKEDFKN